jgi:hypothetical protein
LGDAAGFEVFCPILDSEIDNRRQIVNNFFILFMFERATKLGF